MKTAYNILKQVPFWFFIGLKICATLLILFIYFSELIDPFKTPFGDMPDWVHLFPNSNIILWPVYFIISIFLGLQIRKKSLGWATLFVSIEWIYLLFVILMRFNGIPFSYEYIVV